MQPRAIRRIEERLRQMLQLTGTQSFRATAAFMATVKQSIEVFFDKTRPGTHGTRITEQEKNARTRLYFCACNALQQAIKQLDRRCFVTVDARRQ